MPKYHKYRYIGKTEDFNNTQFINGKIYEGRWTKVTKGVIGIFWLNWGMGHEKKFLGAFYKDFEKVKSPKVIQKEFEEESYKKFLEHLNLAIEAMYNARMENNGAVLSMPIKDLFLELTKPT